jgi:hypothetical protein
MNNDLDLAMSWLQDFYTHFHGRIQGKTADDNVDVCLRLLDYDEANRFFNRDFVRDLRKKVESRKFALIRQAEERIATLKHGR